MLTQNVFHVLENHAFIFIIIFRVNEEKYFLNRCFSRLIFVFKAIKIFTILNTLGKTFQINMFTLTCVKTENQYLCVETNIRYPRSI